MPENVMKGEIYLEYSKNFSVGNICGKAVQRIPLL